MYKIAVMGDYDSIYGFATLGLDTFPVDNLDYGATLLKRLAEDNYAVIYMTEALASDLNKQIQRGYEACDHSHTGDIWQYRGWNSGSKEIR